jgi:serine/threonine-protein kinase
MKNNQSTLQTGDIINDTYTVQIFIGEGKFGEVFRVKHKFLGLQVMKVFKDEYVNESNIDTLFAEARILSQITHPNIVRVFEANTFKMEQKEKYYITTSFVSGETLQKLLSRKIILDKSLTLSLQKDLLMGLSITHKHDPPIIHRDINLDNVLISHETEQLKSVLCDFGLAQTFDLLTKFGDSFGRYIFLAPECFWGGYLPTSDVFSAGIVFYTMLTGMHPWRYIETNNENTDIQTIIFSSRKKQPIKPSEHNFDCDNELDEIVMTALATDFQYRYKNAGEFLDALNKYTSRNK